MVWAACWGTTRLSICVLPPSIKTDPLFEHFWLDERVALTKNAVCAPQSPPSSVGLSSAHLTCLRSSAQPSMRRDVNSCARISQAYASDSFQLPSASEKIALGLNRPAKISAETAFASRGFALTLKRELLRLRHSRFALGNKPPASVRARVPNRRKDLP